MTTIATTSRARASWPAWVIVVAGLLLTVFATLQVRQGIDASAEKQFAAICDQTALKIRERLDAYALILRGGAGLFAASGTVDRGQWRSYVETLRAQRSVPGIQGIGFAQLIAADQLPGHIARIRGEGFPDYSVRPPGERALYSAIIYLEPFRERNLRAFGFDMFSEPVRRAAMEQARDSGEAALSGKVELVQETGSEVQAGTLMYDPVYRNGAAVASVEQRRVALVGWTYSPYRMNDLMGGILADWETGEGKTIDLHIYDGPQAAPAALLFDSRITRAQDAPLPTLQQRRTIDFNGHQWLLTFERPPLASAMDYAPAWAALAGGLALSGLLFGLVLSVIHTRTNAALIAVQLTQDIRQREQWLKDSEFRWKFAIEGYGDGLWDWNVASGTVFFSRAWKSMLGYSEAEIGSALAEWETRLHPDDRTAALATLQNYLDGKSALYASEHRVRCKDGSYKWVSDRGLVVNRGGNGQALRMIGTHRDITERREIDVRVREHAEQLKAIFDLSPDGFVSFDGAHRVKYVSPAFARLTALSEVAVIGLDESEFSRQLAAICLPEARFPGVAALRDSEQLLHKIELADASRRVIDVGLRASQAQSVSQILYLRDVTHETEVDRMKSEFLSTAAHELRTPMASIYGFAEVLLSENFDEANRHEFLAIIYRQSELMAYILNELLDLARIEARRGTDFVFEAVDVQSLIEEVVREFRLPEGRPAPLLDPPTGPLTIWADRRKAQQAILNVLSNAYKYSASGGAVDISWQARSPGLGSELKTASPRPMVAICISDHGIGLAPEQVRRVGERFYRADTSGTVLGTGLGMSIVKEIIELHRGAVEIESEPGQGTSVRLLFPSSSLEPALARPSQFGDAII